MSSPFGTAFRSAILIIVLLSGVCAVRSHAQTAEIGIAYYDVDRLYDTVSSPFYNDRDFTPSGRYHWDSERYAQRIRRTAALLDSMAVPVTALFGVENEAVVRDLSAACKNDYTYIHRTLNRKDGLDFALFYFGDRFFPTRIEEGKSYLYIEGAAYNGARKLCDSLGILLCAHKWALKSAVPAIRKARTGVRLVVMGRFDHKDLKELGLHDATAAPEARGHGNMRNRYGWWMRNRIALDPTLHPTLCDSYIQRWLLDAQGYPLRTLDHRGLRDGYGAYLPVFVYFTAQ